MVKLSPYLIEYSQYQLELLHSRKKHQEAKKKNERQTQSPPLDYGYSSGAREVEVPLANNAGN